MAMYKLALTAAVALTLGACGSSGGGSNALNTDATEKPGQNHSALNSVPKEHQAAVKYAKIFAPYEDDDELTTTKLVIDGKRMKVTDTIDFSALKEGFSEKSVQAEYTETVNGKTRKGQIEAVMKIYQQPYSIVVGTLVKKDSIEPEQNGLMGIDHIRGLATSEQALPTEGKFAYNGVAFSQKEHGQLSYTVDFKERTGKGEITGINEVGLMTLHEAQISRGLDEDLSIMGIAGKMSASKLPNERGYYELGFFGPKAEEIAGEAYFDDIYKPDVGFAGKR